jgi:hypothetical protein
MIIAIFRKRLNRIARLLELLMLSILLFAGSAAAQSGDLYIYPAKGQDKNKQDEDRYDCHSWAVSQTGFDPSKPQANTPSSSGNQPYRPSQPHVLRGGARGAALGAVGGAIAGDAGKGAAAGAATTGLAGGFAGETKEGNKHPSSRPTLNRLSKTSKVLISARWRHVLKAGVTRSDRLSGTFRGTMVAKL